MEAIADGQGTLQLKGELHISGADSLRAALLDAWQGTSGMTLELSGVESCDAASLQLLCALHSSARRSGRTLQILAPSAAMRETSATLGFSLEELAYTPAQAMGTEGMADGTSGTK